MRRGIIAALLCLLPGVVGAQSSPNIAYYPAACASWCANPNDVTYVDEFWGAANTSPYIGMLNWSQSGMTQSGLATQANYPGILNGACGAAAVGTWYIAGPSVENPTLLSAVKSVLFIAQWGTGANVPDKRAGLTSGAVNAAPSTHSVWFEALAADTNWFAVTSAAGGQTTRTDTNVAFAHSTWYRMRIEHPAASTWLFYINDVLVATHGAAQTPPTETTGAKPFQQVVGTGTASTAAMDYFAIRIQVTR